ncbi:hypothetical protein [Kocuria turfanensis]|uniref:DUF4352 domain-containing protein n=1 Tax=Kocuria turfanensis TaxID=388357 RepID=A0A512IDR7_9MICC|nr:hypothetical protein [Kocuria turfanensis]GEO95840.1 hypothetical protein KTU01_19630 [Kocuria turfanensis]
MTALFPPSRGRRAGTVGAALLALALTGCSGDPGGGGPASSAAASSPEASGAEASGAEASGAVEPGAPASGTTASGAASSPAASGTPEPGTAGPGSAAPSGNDVAPYDDTATRDAAAAFGSTQQLTDSLAGTVEGPRPATTGQRPVRAAPGTPVQVFTVTLTNTGTDPVDAVPWSFPVAVAGDEPAVPAYDESLGVRMETFPTIAPGGSASLDVAFSAAPDADLAVRVFDNTTPDHYVEFTD